MRTAIKLILLNLLIAQIIAPILVMIPCVIYLVATTGNLDKDALITINSIHHIQHSDVFSRFS